jgi:hypothetical protein
MKMWQKILAGLLVLAVIGWVLQLTGLAPKQEPAANAKPTGAMYMGGIAAVQMANAGAEKPTAERVNALARVTATKSNVAADDRSQFVQDFEFGFWQGWKTATR